MAHNCAHSDLIDLHNCCHHDVICTHDTSVKIEYTVRHKQNLQTLKRLRICQHI